MNDVITSVNGVNTVDVTHEQAVAALKRAGHEVRLVRSHDACMLCGAMAKMKVSGSKQVDYKSGS